ncbi:unnamed protein product [Trypanosoma congolense IL3000]|uniref:Protein SDA1 n=1 Tax=Trypanosoma congolense (strain IL3000) TaxID=1068625 RepID=F9WFB3_TRYCI|nr:unnamed protein product [Trypanosoma congolense IL3000]
MAETAFRGTLLLLQNRTRRDPEAYRDEFLTQLDHFKALTKTVAAQKEVNPQYLAVLSFVCHVGHCYPQECGEVAEIVVKLLQDFKGSTMTPEMRLALVKSLALLRSKNIVSAERSFPLLFELLQERDKTLRRVILWHIVSDIRRVNLPGSKNGASVNKKAQNFLFGIMADDDPVQARCAEMVMIDLYRRRVWVNERTVEVLTQACFSRHTAIIRTALRFFLLQMPKISSMDDSKGEDDEEIDPGRAISKMKQKLKIKKKTGKRERILKREVTAVKRKYDKEEKEEELIAKQHVDPIRLLRDPQQFVERLLARLQKTSERFEVRLLYLNVIARTVSEHEVVHLPLYSFLERYMEPSQLHSTQLLALSVMCAHRMVPPDTLMPLVRAIANHFVSDRSSPDAITVGLNTIREICKRQPLAMEEDLLKDLVEYKSQRGDRGVMMAARALLQLYRHVYPALLPSKLRGKTADPSTGEAPRPVYGKEHVYTDIPGLELLYADDGINSSSDSCCSDSDSSDDDSSDGTWVTDSSECDPDDIQGEFVDVSDSSDTDNEEEEDECPQLVAVNSPTDEPPRKVAKYEGNVQGNTPIAGVTQHTPPNSNEVTGACEEVSHEEDGEFSSEESEEDGEESGEETEQSMDSSEEYEETDEGESVGDEEDEEEGEEYEEEGGEAGLAPTTRPDDGKSEWFEDTEVNSTRPSLRSTASKVSSSAVRILTDEDFARIRALQRKHQHESLHSRRKKSKDIEARAKRREALIHGISANLTSEDIEHFTEKKRTEDREEKIARTEELRRSKSKFEARKKKKSKLNSTHAEHSKRGKLYSMTKRSRRVGAKLKVSVADRSNKKKENKKKDIKFRIRRGWKA